MLRLLLWQKASVRRNELFRGSWRQRIGRLLGLLFGAVFIYFVYVISKALFAWLDLHMPGAAPALIATSFSGLAAFALFWGVGGVMTDLYLATDLELLMAMPVPRGAIFWLKLFEAMWRSVVPALIAVTTLGAYGVAAGVDWTYYVALVLVLFLLLTLLAAASMILVMLLMRLVPARRAREVYSLVYVVFFAAAWLGWMLLSNSHTNPVAYVVRLGPKMVEIGRDLAWSPATWAGKMMVAWAQGGAWNEVLANAVPLLALGVALVALAYLVFERSFYRGWSTMLEVAPRRRTDGRRQQAPTLVATLSGWLPSPAAELAFKDWTVLPRDLRQLSGMIMPLVVSLFYIYQFGFASREMAGVPGAGFWLSLAISPLVPLFMVLFLGTPAIGKEGENFELLRTVPVPASGILWGKFWMAVLPTLLIAAVVDLAVALLLGVSRGQVLLLAVLLVLTTSGMTLAAVAFGALAPNFRASDYRRSAGPLATYGTMLAGGAIWVALLLSMAAIALLAPENAAIAMTLQRVFSARSFWGTLFGSPLVLLPAALVDALVIGGFRILWRAAVRRIEAWQPSEA